MRRKSITGSKPRASINYVPERIVQLRLARGMSQSELGEKTGLRQETIHRIESGKQRTSKKGLLAIAKALQSDVAYLKGETALISTSKESGVKPSSPAYLPIYGQVPGGPPHESDQYLEGEYQVLPELWRESRYILRVTGDSMEGPKGLCNGDLVLMEKVSGVDSRSLNGKICAVILNGESTLKRVYVKGDTVELRPENPQYTSIQVIKRDEFTVQGVMISIVRGIR
jgi:SOS-response transcriptional repressor LexA